MKINKFYTLVIASIFSQIGFSQSTHDYLDMESRFTKSTLTSADSSAFIEAGILKAKSLFEYGDVYISNSNNRSNQAYVIQRVPNLFYVSEGDSLNTIMIMSQINLIIENERPKPVDIIFIKKEGVLGHVSTQLKNLNFEVDIILIKVPKVFGNTEEYVWQVFLANPIFW